MPGSAPAIDQDFCTRSYSGKEEDPHVGRAFCSDRVNATRVGWVEPRFLAVRPTKEARCSVGLAARCGVRPTLHASLLPDVSVGLAPRCGVRPTLHATRVSSAQCSVGLAARCGVRPTLHASLLPDVSVGLAARCGVRPTLHASRSTHRNPAPKRQRDRTLTLAASHPIRETLPVTHTIPVRFSSGDFLIIRSVCVSDATSGQTLRFGGIWPLGNLENLSEAGRDIGTK